MPDDIGTWAEPAGDFLGFRKKRGSNPHYPAIAVLFVADLAHPDWLVEKDEVAIVAG